MTRTIYTDQLADEIIEMICQGKTLTQVCEELDLNKVTLINWIERNHRSFGRRFYAARKQMTASLVDEIIHLADDCPPIDGALKKATLQIRTRQWLVEKLYPNVFAQAGKEPEYEDTAAVAKPADFLKAWNERHGVPANKTGTEG